MTKCSLGTVYTVTDTYEGYTIQSGDIRDYVTFSFKVLSIYIVELRNQESYWKFIHLFCGSLGICDMG